MKALYILFVLGLSISHAYTATESRILSQKGNNVDENSVEDELLGGSYVLPKQIFNEGKPFYLDKDPVSGQFDFSSKKPAGIEPEANEVIDQKEKNIILNNGSPNFHDFLNLPVKYSSSKFVYPLVSSSYANLKYQGNNKNFISNHKNYTSATPNVQNYYSNLKLNATKLRPSEMGKPQDILVTTSKPIVTSSENKVVTKYKFNPTKKMTTTTTMAPTTSSKPYSTSKRPTISLKNITTVTTKLPKTTHPTIKPTTLTTRIPSTTSTSSSTSSTTTTVLPSKSASTTSIPRTTPTSKKVSTPPSTESFQKQYTSEKPIFKPLPISTTAPTSTLDAGEMYNVIGYKKDPNTMSLADLFNALAESEPSYAPSEQGLNVNGDLMRPISPGKPAPFSPKPSTLTSVSQTGPLTTNFPETMTTEGNLQAVPQHYANDYVRYEVQQPNMNMVNFHPAPSMNSIVISPEQSSASFVVGSQQTVGAGQYVGSSEKEPVLGNGQRIQYGTVINEEISSVAQHQSQGQQTQPLFEQQGQQINYFQPQPMPQNGNDQQTQELYVSSNIRFPSEEFTNEQIAPAMITDQVNGHSAPIALPHIQQNPQSQSISFPTNDHIQQQENNQDLREGTNKIVFMPTGSSEDAIVQKQEILTLNQQQLQNKFNFPQLPEDLTPPQPPEPHRMHLGGVDPSHRQQAPPRPGPNPSYLYNEFTRKPLPGLHRSNPERPLPNILPQFRPNAKISNGHPTYNKEPVNVRMNHPNGPFPNRPPMPPPFSHRRTPIGNRYNFKKNQEPMEANRRVYRVSPPVQHQHQHQLSPQMIDRIYMQHQPQMLNKFPPPPPLQERYVDGFPLERNAGHSEPSFNLPDLEMKQERLPAFEEEDFIVNNPPKAVITSEQESHKLEPVVTLQMLQTQKKPVLTNLEASQPAAQKLISDPAQSPVYVVYPIKSSPVKMDTLVSAESEEPVVVGQRGDQPPVPPVDINAMGADYQNTPFSVVRDQPQEPILMVKNKSQIQSKLNFPYPLEKPDPAFAEFSKQKDLERYDRDAAEVHLSPRVVNRGNVYTSDIDDDVSQKTNNRPIAIAYTPTESNPYYAAYYADQKFSIPNVASQVIPEIRDTQTESSFNEEIDTRGQNYEKDFMAPFYPSMSLTGMTNAHNGWAVVPGSTERPVYEKNNINRADVKDTDISSVSMESDEEESSTKKFDNEQFQPELQGGFKPIYPPDYKSKDAEDVRDQVDQRQPEINNSSSTTITTERQPEQRTKSKLEASIESLLFGDDEDFEDAVEPESDTKS